MLKFPQTVKDPDRSMTAPQFSKLAFCVLVSTGSLGCTKKAADIPPSPTTLTGQVFTQSADGSQIRASGRVVSLTKPTAEANRLVNEACALSDRMSASIMARLNGERRVGTDELPVQLQGQLQSEMLTTGIHDAFANSGQQVAKATADADGRFRFDNVQSGAFVITVKHDQAMQRFAWTDTLTIRSNQENSVILGTDAAKWVGLCARISDLTASTP